MRPVSEDFDTKYIEQQARPQQVAWSTQVHTEDGLRVTFAG
jgi:hypothetical protein